MKVLIVDDSLLDRKLLVRIFMKAGVAQEIIQAEDGEQGLELLATNYKDICLMLLDWQMPKMSGIELMAGVMKVPELEHIPIIMVTASGSDENKQTAYKINPKLAGYVVKPYKPEELIAAVKPYLR